MKKLRKVVITLRSFFVQALDFIRFRVYYVRKVVESGVKFHKSGVKWWIS